MKFSILFKEECSSKSCIISGIASGLLNIPAHPQGEIFSNLVGFVNADNKGSAGLEFHLDPKIKIFNKSNFIKRGGDGTPLPDLPLVLDYAVR